MSSALGSMSPETSCKVNFTWHYPGSSAYRALLGNDESVDTSSEIERGYLKIQNANSAVSEIKSDDPSIQKHLYLNYRQYVGSKVSS